MAAAYAMRESRRAKPVRCANGANTQAVTPRAKSKRPARRALLPPIVISIYSPSSQAGWALFFLQRISEESCIFHNNLQLVCSFKLSFMQKKGAKPTFIPPRCIFGLPIIFLDIFRKNGVLLVKTML
jgi:hypothetical protein